MAQTTKKLSKTQKLELGNLYHGYKYPDASTCALGPYQGTGRGYKQTRDVLQALGLMTYTTQGHPFGREYPVLTEAGVAVALQLAPKLTGCGCWRCS